MDDTLKPYIKPLAGLAAVMLLCIALGLALAPGGYAAKSPLQAVSVNRVIDGDTIEADGVVCRLHGIDAPECKGSQWPEQPFAMAARQYLIRRLDGQRPLAEFRGSDRYGRRIVTLYIAGGVNVNQDLVQAGLAHAAVKYSKAYVDDQAEARKVRAGLWCDEAIEPEAWRRGVRPAIKATVEDDE